MVDSKLRRRWWHAFAAVVLGNAIYFAVMERLPPGARHEPFRIDWGLAVDAWICLACYGLLARLKWFQ